MCLTVDRQGVCTLMRRASDPSERVGEREREDEAGLLVPTASPGRQEGASRSHCSRKEVGGKRRSESGPRTWTRVRGFRGKDGTSVAFLDVDGSIVELGLKTVGSEWWRGRKGG